MYRIIMHHERSALGRGSFSDMMDEDDQSQKTGSEGNEPKMDHTIESSPRCEGAVEKCRKVNKGAEGDGRGSCSLTCLGHQLDFSLLLEPVAVEYTACSHIIA